MPELPEVETTCRGIRPALEHQTVQKVILRQPKLRWPVPQSIMRQLPGLTILRIWRRAKYLIFDTECGQLVIHLGMSGRLRLLTEPTAPQKHDHADFEFNHVTLRYTDPRRFGAILWETGDILTHRLLASLGPEPLSTDFNANYLLAITAKKNSPIKSVLMDQQVVVGVGNIYANEALFHAGIRPDQSAKTLSKPKASKLVTEIKKTLEKAINAGGTTLKDFYASNGQPGYFTQQLFVYGRENEDCLRCKTPLQKMILAQRSTVFCPNCQSSN